MAFIEGVRLTSPTHLATRLEMRLSFIHISQIVCSCTSIAVCPSVGLVAALQELVIRTSLGMEERPVYKYLRVFPASQLLQLHERRPVAGADHVPLCGLLRRLRDAVQHGQLHEQLHPRCCCSAHAHATPRISSLVDCPIWILLPE